jgi:hypothetical protein
MTTIVLIVDMALMVLSFCGVIMMTRKSEPTFETEDSLATSTSNTSEHPSAGYTTKCTVLVDRIQPNAHDSVRLNVTSR